MSKKHFISFLKILPIILLTLSLSVNVSFAAAPPATNICVLFPELCVSAPIPGGPGQLTINTIPSLNTAAYIDGSPVTIMSGTSGAIEVDSGLHTVVFDDVEGYITPAPPEGRKVYVSEGENKTLTVTYFKESDLKGIDTTTAEMLYFDPNIGNSTVHQYNLTRGVSAISADGEHWQYSAAELLLIGAMPPEIFISKSTPGYDNLIPIGDSDIDTNYEITFQTAGGTTLTADPYTAVLTDEIIVTCPAEEPDCGDSVWLAGPPTLIPPLPGLPKEPSSWEVDASRKKITITMTTADNLVHPLEYKMSIPLHIEGSQSDGDGVDPIPSSTKIENIMEFNVNNGLSVEDNSDDPYETTVVGAFLQERRSGSVYAEGAIRLRTPGTVTYIIGSGGDIEAVSEANWRVGTYDVRSGSTTDFDITNCPPYSACDIMNNNIIDAINGADLGVGSTMNANIDLNPNNIPEGGITYYDGDLNIGSSGVGIEVSGRGTIIVENGDLNINSDITYADDESIMGIIVKNGNINISSEVRNLVGIYYVYTEGANGGSFIVKSRDPGYDDQFVLEGLIIASGRRDIANGERKDAFVLSRNYIGNLDNVNPYDKSTWEPAEVFEYDSRVIIEPPPSFSSQIFQVRD